MYEFLQAAGFVALFGAVIWYLWSVRSKKDSSDGSNGKPPSDGPGPIRK